MTTRRPNYFHDFLQFAARLTLLSSVSIFVLGISANAVGQSTLSELRSEVRGNGGSAKKPKRRAYDEQDEQSEGRSSIGLQWNTAEVFLGYDY